MELYIKTNRCNCPCIFCNWYRLLSWKKNPEISTDFITTFAGNVGTPAMIFYTITSTGVTLETFIEYFIYALIIIGGFSLVGVILFFY